MLTDEQNTLIKNFKLDRNSWINGWVISLYKNDIPIHEIVSIIQNAEYHSYDVYGILIRHLQNELDMQGGK